MQERPDDAAERERQKPLPLCFARRCRRKKARCFEHRAFRFNMKGMFRSLSSIILLCLLPAFSFAQSTSRPAAVHLEDASDYGQEIFENSGTTGMVLVVVHGNKVFIQGYGETAPHSHETPTKDSVVRLCSLTKIFTTDLLTKLVLDHTVQLSDPLQKYAPAGARVPERNQQPITLLHLATHTAGLHRELGYPPNGMAHFTYPDAALRWNWLPKQQLRFTPGTVASYSNIGYDLLSDAIQAAARKPYPALLAERTLKPLHMWETTYYPTPAQCSRLMLSAQDNGECTVTANTEGSSGLYSTPTDMARWLKYLLGTGEPGFPAQPHQAQDAYIAPDQLVRQSGLEYGGDPSGIGLGWIHVLPANDPSHIVEKTGGGAGYLTYIVLHPASHTAMFVAATEGRRLPHVTHFNLFKASNKILLRLVGAPPIPEEEEKPRAKMRRGQPAKTHAQAAVQPKGKAHGKAAAKPAPPTRKQATKSHEAPSRKKPVAKPRAHTTRKRG
jgi:D-alanyl-D-alanine-carboxypeptidase/D-alanyl-D-alanine-endopeptidase